MLSDDVWEPLRAAVPSFAGRWREVVQQPWYESDATYGVSELARHLVDEAGAGRSTELPAFFAALDALLASASDEVYDVLTIGLLEDVVHEAEQRDVALKTFARAARGARARTAWNDVVAIIERAKRPPSR